MSDRSEGDSVTGEERTEAALLRGTLAERLRLRLVDMLNRCVFFPLANLGDAADRVGDRVNRWAERQR